MITNPKISCPLFDIHKSKLAVGKWHSTEVNKTYNCFVWSTSLGNNSWIYLFLNGNTIPGHKCILNLFNQLLSTNYKRRWFLKIKNPESSNFCFYFILSFLKRFLCNKKIGYGTRKHISSLFRRLPFIFLQRIIHFFSKKFKILLWSKFTCFPNVAIPLIVLYIINLLIAWVFGFEFKTRLLWWKIQCMTWRIVTSTSLLSLTQ